MESDSLDVYEPTYTEDGLVIFIQRTITIIIYVTLAILFTTGRNKN